MPPAHERLRSFRSALRPLLVKLNLAVWLECCLPAVSVMAGVWGSGLLLLKMLGSPWLHLAYASGLLLLAAPLYGYWRARRRSLFFAPCHAAELADHRCGNDGLVSAYFEAPELYPGLDPETLAHEIREALRQRSPRLDAPFFLKRLAPAGVFLVAACLIPARPSVPSAIAGQAALRALTQPIVERLEEHKDRLPEERLQDLLADLQQLQESREGLTREKWEALEHLEQQMQDALDQSRQATMNVSEAIQDLTSSPGFRDNPLAAADSPQFQSALKDLQDAVNLASQSLPQELLDQLQSAVQQCQGMCQGGGQLSGVDRDTLMQLAQQLQGELEDLLQELNSEADGAAGRGGLDRGRADAPMVFGSPQELEDAQFERDRLRNRYLSPEDLVDMGITLLRPEPDPGKFSPGTLRSYEGERGQAVSRTRISPSQREVVGRYFSDQ